MMDKIRDLCYCSSKNQREPRACAYALEREILEFGRVLGTCWVASSFRSIKALSAVMQLCTGIEDCT